MERQSLGATTADRVRPIHPVCLPGISPGSRWTLLQSSSQDHIGMGISFIEEILDGIVLCT